jgi:hypothetical protein
MLFSAQWTFTSQLILLKILLMNTPQLLCYYDSPRELHISVGVNMCTLS